MLPKQKRFCEEYIKDLNATQAAIRAGYSVKTSYSIGSENLKKPEIAAFIKDLLKEKTIDADQTVKLISDISRSSLNDYFTVRMVERRPRVKKTLKKILAEMEARYMFEEEFAARANLTKEQLETHERMQAALDLQIFRYKMELEKNPKATKIVDGEPELVEEVELDLVKLSKDKDAGRIKSIKHGQFGPAVELYAADAALRDMAKLHGLFTTKVEHSGSLDFTGFLMEHNTIEEEENDG